MRFKNPPSADSSIGWRVEFRPIDVQLTDYENAALTVATGMLVNMLNEFKLDFLLPISKVDENMDRAHECDAIINKKFWWRTDLFVHQQDYNNNNLQTTDFLSSTSSCTGPTSIQTEKSIEMKELYLWQILEGDKTIGLEKGLI